MVVRPLALALIALVSSSAVAAAQRAFPASGFDRVSASGSEDIVITTGKAASVVATGPQERLDRLRIRVENGKLMIDHKPGSSWSWGRNDQVRIAITMPALHGVHASGSGNLSADKGSGPAFEGSLSGSGDLSIARIDSPSVTLRTSGSGDIAAAGQCRDAKVSISGSGNMTLPNLACTNINIAISGSGDVAARATGAADIRISGSGDVVIAGGARCNSRTSGSGDVTCG
ncbi:head GIN domain-containing protein [Sandarakinorhabdus sp. DWP1-3-1]|uniref:head GIN domain-containing protein n=1 Tax=Sandarakinorhabdus sp. DWP1-3-1 TaxID=2804627 RepID=UPI003CF11E87